MFAKTFVYSVFALVAANQAMGAAVPTAESQVGEAAILIATDAFYACNCPNNCDHKEGSSCKFYSGPSDSSGVISGHCHYPNGNHLAAIECVP